MLGALVQHLLDKGFAAFGAVPRIFDAHIDDLFIDREGVF
jgi:hypothetical protein